MNVLKTFVNVYNAVTVQFIAMLTIEFLYVPYVEETKISDIGLDFEVNN